MNLPCRGNSAGGTTTKLGGDCYGIVRAWNEQHTNRKDKETKDRGPFGLAPTWDAAGTCAETSPPNARAGGFFFFCFSKAGCDAYAAHRAGR